jgi:hypothetical protein
MASFSGKKGSWQDPGPKRVTRKFTQKWIADEKGYPVLSGLNPYTKV